jgi:hypothetical protein
MKNLKLPEQIRDLVLLLILAGVACLVYPSTDCTTDRTSKPMRGTWGERILPRSDQPQTSPPPPGRKSWGVEVKSKGSKPKKEPKKVY